MKRAFREAYNRELAILKERSTEFAEDYPGLADRLGGLMEENLDPAIAGLLEGSAFMAARVQLKMDEEFQTFTHELLNQIFPDSLLPTPSAMLVQANPPFENGDLVGGVTFEAGNYIDARFADADRRVTCRFQLAGDLVMWPIAVTGLKYHQAVSTIGALGQDVASGTKAGLEIELARVDTSGRAGKGGPLSEIAVDDLPFHFLGPLGEAVWITGSSAMVFHSPHAVHCPAQRPDVAPQDWQT